MNHLLRALAPISETGWELLDAEARQRLEPALAARRIVDFRGPHGWEYSATNLGRTARLDAEPTDGVSARQRRVLPLIELRTDFELAREELRDADRGAEDLDLATLDDAALRLARAENIAVFHGWPDGPAGIADSSPHEPEALGEDPHTYPRQVAQALERLLSAGVGGPYALALGYGYYRRAIESTEPGSTIADHLKAIIEGPLVWAPGLNGGALVSLRGGDFILDSGQDVSIGYDSHDGETVRLYLEESLSFEVATPEAAVALQPEAR
jgi:uncharacterized linocin/CFP29 family protein